jgi:cytochrome c-type biogenesis protein CcmH
MRRLVLLALCGLALAPAAAASERHPTLAELESEVMCPICKQPLDQSDSAAAKRIEAYIQRRIDAGATKSEIEDDLVDQFGPAILAEPQRHGFDLLAWLLPILGAAAALVAVGAAALHWTRLRPSDEEQGQLDPELDRQVDDALERYEG